MLSHDEQGARDANAAEIQFAKTRASVATAAAASFTEVTAGDVGQPATPVAILATPTVILEIAQTPILGGSFTMHAHYKVTSDGGAPHTVTPQLAYKKSSDVAWTVVAQGEAINIPAVAGTPSTDSIDGRPTGLQVRPPQLYDFALLLTADAATHLTIATNGAQLNIQE